MAEGKGPPRGNGPGGNGPGSGPPASVLVVDDDADTAVSAQEAIERFVPGAHVTVATSFSGGLRAIERGHVDLALVDYRMPGHDGLEFAGRAHRLEPGLPVILMTGHGSLDVAARAINRHGVRGFLPKPFDAVVLAETVRHALTAA